MCGARQADRRAAPAAEHDRRPVAPASRPAWSHQLRLDLAGQPERNEANVITALGSRRGLRRRRRLRRVPAGDPGHAAAALGRPEQSRCRGPGRDADDVRAAEWLQRREIERDARDRQPQRRRRGARDRRASGSRLSRRAQLGRRAPPRDLDRAATSAPRTPLQPQRRRALADLGRRPHLPARRQGRPHADPRRAAGREEVDAR